MKNMMTPHITLAILRSNFKFESSKPASEGLLRQLLYAVVFIPKPADGSVVPRIAPLQYCAPLGTRIHVATQKLLSLIAREHVVQVTEIQKIDNFLRTEIDEQSPQRHLTTLRPQIEARICK